MFTSIDEEVKLGKKYNIIRLEVELAPSQGMMSLSKAEKVGPTFPPQPRLLLQSPLAPLCCSGARGLMDRMSQHEAFAPRLGVGVNAIADGLRRRRKRSLRETVFSANMILFVSALYSLRGD